MAFRNPIAPLLGAFTPQQPDPYQSLLGNYYDPKREALSWLGGNLAGVGMGLASGKPGAWATGGIQGGQDAIEDYRRQALAGYGLQQRKQEYDYQQQQRQEEAAAAQAEEDAQAAWFANPDDKNLFAKAYPTQYASQYAQSLFPGQEEPKRYNVGGALVDANGRVVYQGQGNTGTYSVTLPDGTRMEVGGKPLTEGQSKDTVFSTRAEGALPYIDNGEAALVSKYDSTVEDIPFVGNYLTSDKYQVASSAGDEFLQALLRKDTGATIQPFEIQEYGSVYLPQPGDKPDRLKYKKEARTRALAAMKAGMPAQAIVAQERALATPGASGGSMPQAQTAISAPAAKVGDVINDPSAIPEGATVIDESGAAYRMVNGQLQKVQ